MRRRGFTFIELLVSVLLLTIALSGLLALWAFGFTTAGHSQDLGVGYSIARQEAEKAKNVGFLLLPEGTTTRYYDGLGHVVTTAASSRFTATSTVVTIPHNGQIDSNCLRTLRVQVAERGGRTVFDTTTYLTQGGV